MDRDLGDHGAILVGPKRFGAGEQALRCCQGLDEQGRALSALPGTQCRQGGVQGLQSQFLYQSYVTGDTVKIPFCGG